MSENLMSGRNLRIKIMSGKGKKLDENSVFPLLSILSLQSTGYKSKKQNPEV